MKILSITAQKPDSTGSGVYLTELVKAFDHIGHKQAIIAGVCEEDTLTFPSHIDLFPVYYKSPDMPFPIAGMSDEMPYESTRYSDMTEIMVEQFTRTFREQILHAVEEFQPDVILCHHLYLLTSIVRTTCPNLPVYGICHGSDLRQIKKNPKQREFILEQIPKLNGILALHEEQKKQIIDLFCCNPESVSVIGTGYNSDIFFNNPDVDRDDEPLSLLFAGKISEKKGVMSLLRSLQYMDVPLRLSLAGGYGNKNEYEAIQQIADMATQGTMSNRQVRFLGKLNHEQLAREMNQHHIFILPSFYEGLPLVIMEALACGMKVVCTDLPGIKPWLDANLPNNEVVFVTPPAMQNEDEPLPESLEPFERRLAEAIITCTHAQAEDPARMRKLSWNGLAEKLSGIIMK